MKKTLICFFVLLYLLTGCKNKTDDSANKNKMNNNIESSDSMDSFVKNSDNSEKISDFSYLWLIETDNKKAKKEKARDVITLTLLSHEGERPELWIVDVKMKKIYFSISMDYFYDVSEARFCRELSKDEITGLLKVFEDANTISWKRTYSGENEGKGSFEWKVYIEYKSGNIEKHNGSGMTVLPPDGFYNIRDYLKELCEK